MYATDSGGTYCGANAVDCAHVREHHDCLLREACAFDQDVQAVPQDNEEVAALVPAAEYHLFEGMGHCSIYGHTQDILNPFIKGLVQRYL